jgi:hypothetical protein
MFQGPFILHSALSFQVQFVLLGLHGYSALFIKDCSYSRIMAFVVGTQNLFMIVLFSSFYKKSYATKKVV